jgi:hypothetical protein
MGSGGVGELGCGSKCRGGELGRACGLGSHRFAATQRHVKLLLLAIAYTSTHAATFANGGVR